jgi:hypothetical protein
MNENEPFEKRLQRQPLREAPFAWRAEILAHARACRDESRVANPASRVTSRFSILYQQLSTLLWPHPRAWAGLAAAWVLICALNLAYREDAPPASAHRVVPPSPQMRELLRAQEQLLAELVEEPAVAGRVKAAPPRPHSFHRNELANA